MLSAWLLNPGILVKLSLLFLDCCTLRISADASVSYIGCKGVYVILEHSVKMFQLQINMYVTTLFSLEIVHPVR